MTTFRALETAALVAGLLVALALFLRREAGPAMLAMLAASVLLIAEASLMFLLGEPWNDVWWLAHATFAAGFLLLGLGMVRAYETTRSMRHVFSERELFRRLERRTRELESTNARLSASNQALQRANESLGAFSYVISHDLKEPVRALHALTGALAEDHAGQLDEEGRFLVRATRDANLRLEAMVTGLLELSRALRAGEQDLHPVWVEAVVEDVECKARYGDLMRERAGRLEIVTLQGTPPILATKPMACQILGNLVVNALKHNPKAAPLVRVRTQPLDADGTMVEVVVEDNGAGFPDRVVSWFNGASGNPQSLRGAGFGLLIVRRAVEHLGGRAWVGRSPEGGAAVHLVFPAASAEGLRPDAPAGAAAAGTAAPAPLAASPARADEPRDGRA